MANTLPTDANNVLYEGIRDGAGQEFVAKAAGVVTTDAGGVKSAPQLIQSTDGAQATIGTTTDAAYGGSGSASVVAALKGVYGRVAGTLVAKIVDAGGTNELAVDASGHIGVNNFPATQAVSGTVGVNNFPATQAVSGTVSVNNFPATQAISATALPLPTGAALEAGGHLATIDTSTAAVDTATGTQADAAYTSGSGSIIALLKGLYTKLAGTLTVGGTVGVNNFPATQAVSGTVSVNNFPATQAISATALPLPTGAALEAGHLATIDTSTAAVDTATGTQADAAYTTGNGTIIALLKGIFGKLAGTLTVGGTVGVNNFPATQAVSGIVTANAGTNLNTSALALESGGNLAAAKADLDTVVAQTAGLVAGSKVALSAPPATLTAGADTSLTFSSQVRHLYVQNKSSSDVTIEFDATSSAGSFIIPGSANTLVQFDLPCTVLHCFCAAAIAVNGTTGGNLVVEGRA